MVAIVGVVRWTARSKSWSSPERVVCTLLPKREERRKEQMMQREMMRSPLLKRKGRVRRIQATTRECRRIIDGQREKKEVSFERVVFSEERKTDDLKETDRPSKWKEMRWRVRSRTVCCMINFLIINLVRESLPF